MTRFARACVLVVAVACGCATETAPPDEERAWVLDAVGFPGVTDGTAPGFDLDGRTSERDDAAGCFHSDLVDEEGRTGIDNQLAVLRADLEGVIGDAVDGIVAGAIRGGQLLLVVRVRGLDDPVSDDSVEVTVTQATGVPLVGTDGTLLPLQTLEVEADPQARWFPARVVDGVLETDPMDLVLALEILVARFDLVLHDARVRLAVDGGEDLVSPGVLGGGTPTADLLALIESTDEDTLKAVAPAILESAADLRPDATGACADLSIGLTYQAVPVFLWE